VIVRVIGIGIIASDHDHDAEEGALQ
jgi:hypothetical protein